MPDKDYFDEDIVTLLKRLNSFKPSSFFSEKIISAVKRESTVRRRFMVFKFALSTAVVFILFLFFALISFQIWNKENKNIPTYIFTYVEDTNYMLNNFYSAPTEENAIELFLDLWEYTHLNNINVSKKKIEDDFLFLIDNIDYFIKKS